MGRHVGLFQAQIDGMEIWELGETFGLRPDGTPDREDEPSAPRSTYDATLLAERSQARLEGRPLPPLPPTAPPKDASTVTAMRPPLTPEG